MPWCLIIVAVIAGDHWVKHMVVEQLAAGESRPVFDGWFSLTYLRNTGAAFSLFRNHTSVLTVVTAAVLVLLLIYVIRHRHGHPACLTALSLVIGGGIGNLIDRAARGYVVDMFDFHFFPVFNVADICVVAGCILLAVYALFLAGRPRRRRRTAGRSR
jgi:signal peptidase II